MFAVPADIEAVGTPEATFKKANFALVEDVPPMAKSYVELIGDNKLSLSCK